MKCGKNENDPSNFVLLDKGLTKKCGFLRVYFHKVDIVRMLNRAEEKKFETA